MGVSVGGRPTGPSIGVIFMPSVDSTRGELLARTEEFAVVVVRETPTIYAMADGYEVFPTPRASSISALDASIVWRLPVGDNKIHRDYCEAREQFAANVVAERETKRGPAPGGFGFDVLVGGIPSTPPSRRNG